MIDHPCPCCGRRRLRATCSTHRNAYDHSRRAFVRHERLLCECEACGSRVALGRPTVLPETACTSEIA